MDSKEIAVARAYIKLTATDSATWYQTPPNARFVPLPDRDDLEII